MKTLMIDNAGLLFLQGNLVAAKLICPAFLASEAKIMDCFFSSATLIDSPKSEGEI